MNLVNIYQTSNMRMHLKIRGRYYLRWISPQLFSQSNDSFCCRKNFMYIKKGTWKCSWKIIKRWCKQNYDLSVFFDEMVKMSSTLRIAAEKHSEFNAHLLTLILQGIEDAVIKYELNISSSKKDSCCVMLHRSFKAKGKIDLKSSSNVIGWSFSRIKYRVYSLPRNQ